MKTLILSLLLACSFIPLASAQQRKLFISKQGGTKSWRTFGKVGYDAYYFTNSPDQSDTLMCSGSGNHFCKIDHTVMAMNPQEKSTYRAFNAAIRATEKHIKKSASTSGEFYYPINGHQFFITYDHADESGNAEIQLILL